MFGRKAVTEIVNRRRLPEKTAFAIFILISGVVVFVRSDVCSSTEVVGWA